MPVIMSKRRLRRTCPKVRLDVPSPVLDHFKAGGPGWQTRMIEVLEREVRHG